MKPSAPEAQNELERRILHSLAAEWRLAASLLEREHFRRLRLPAFELRNLDRMLGIWEREKRAIVLSRRFVHEHPWICVRDVLLHEMAHQLADEFFGGDSTPHGSEFKKACRLLSITPNASGDYAPLSDLLRTDELPENDRILLRVRKLLAMAQSSNRHEAEVAVAKAHEHIAKYNIDLLSAGRERSYCSICIGEPAVRHTADKYALSALLRDFYFVQTVLIPVYVPDRAKTGRTLEISGTPENIKLASYVHAFLERAIKDQLKAFQDGGRLRRRQAIDFALGLIKGFREKLQRQEKSLEMRDATTCALILKSDAKLSEYLRERYPRLRTLWRRGRSIDRGVFDAGVHAGRKIILSKPIERKSTNDRLLIGMPC